MAQVSGALVRQLRKRFESDNLDHLSSDLIDQAYRNEIARVVRSWPASVSWMGPMRFYGTAHLLRRFFAQQGWVSPPGVMVNEYLPSILDQWLPTTIRTSKTKIVYASPSLRRMVNGIPVSFFEEPVKVGWLLDRESAKKAEADRERMLCGSDEWVDREYTSIIAGVDKLVMMAGTVLWDDDGDRIGELSVLADAATLPASTREGVRRGALKVFGMVAGLLLVAKTVLDMVESEPIHLLVTQILS